MSLLYPSTLSWDPTLSILTGSYLVCGHAEWWVSSVGHTTDYCWNCMRADFYPFTLNKNKQAVISSKPHTSCLVAGYLTADAGPKGRHVKHRTLSKCCWKIKIGYSSCRRQRSPVMQGWLLAECTYAQRVNHLSRPPTLPYKSTGNIHYWKIVCRFRLARLTSDDLY